MIATYTVPGTTLRIPLRKGDVSVVLLDFLARYHREVESLYHNPQDLWGYADRTIRGSSDDLSNHASGTAADHRAVDHPLGVRGTFTDAEERALDALLADYDGVLRHGKDYSGRADEMHVEINAGGAAVKQVADRIRSGTPGPAPGPTMLRLGDSGPAVVDLQRRLGITADGEFGPITEAAVRAFQAAHDLVVDGIAGPATLAALTPATPAPAPEDDDMTDDDRRLLREIHQKLHGRHPTRVDYRTIGERPPPIPYADDIGGYAINADARAYEARQLVQQVRAAVQQLAARPGGGAGGPVAVTDADVARIAAAVVDQLARRIGA